MTFLKAKNAPATGAIIIVFLGCVNIISAVYPAINSRLIILREILPLHLIQNAQTCAVIIGLFLIILARGLSLKRRRALELTLLLLLIECCLNFLKGLDYEEAILTATIGIWLFSNRKQFFIKSKVPPFKKSIQVIILITGLYFSYLCSGYLILRRYVFPAPTLPHIILEPFRSVYGLPYFHYLTAQSQWFGRSQIFIGITLLSVAIIQLIRPLLPSIDTHETDLLKAADILKKHGDDTLSYFSLQDNRQYFFHASGDAFLSYRIEKGVAVVAGDPTGNKDNIPELIGSFITTMYTNALIPCFLGVSDAYKEIFDALHFKSMKIGEEAIIDISAFNTYVLKKKVRRALRHCENERISICVYKCNEVPEEILTQLHSISKEWLDIKGGYNYGYSMTLARIPNDKDKDCEFIIAMQNGKALGYLGMVPVYKRKAWSLDAMRRRKDAPNGLMEFLIIKTAEEYKKRGFNEMSLNFATFANSNKDTHSTILAWVQYGLFTYFSSFYNLQSLYSFNNKFNPKWHNRYIIFPNQRCLPVFAIAIIKCEKLLPLPFFI